MRLRSIEKEHSNDGIASRFRRLGTAAGAVPIGLGPSGLRGGRVRLRRSRIAVGGGLVLSRAGSRLLLWLAGAEGNARVKPNCQESGVRQEGHWLFLPCSRLSPTYPWPSRQPLSATACLKGRQ